MVAIVQFTWALINLKYLKFIKKQTNAYLVLVAVIQITCALIHVQGAVLTSPTLVAGTLVGVR